jgi:hypothetical protein
MVKEYKDPRRPTPPNMIGIFPESVHSTEYRKVWNKCKVFVLGHRLIVLKEL